MSALKKIEHLGRFATSALDLLLPPRCLATGQIVDRQGMLAPEFWSEIHFIEAPFCAACGIPFAFAAPENTLCAACIETTPAFDCARAAAVYNDATRKIILGFKYGDRTQAVATFTPWLLRTGRDMLAQSDIILPVPLHAKRLWKRRFNQSALLAENVARSAGKKYLPDALIRLRHTVPQQGLSRRERTKNVHGAFGVSTRHAGTLHAGNILLVDDVFTSGATLNECARTLKATGAAKVFILTIARVTREAY